jgi:2-phosphosulfolactate phosphatase
VEGFGIVQAEIVSLRQYEDGPGTVVVIDAIRAFATAATLFDRGVGAMWCVETMEHAESLVAAHGAWFVGENAGRDLDLFDFDNSPRAVSAFEHGGRPVVFRTTNGTKGLMAARRATTIMALGATTVGATACWIARHRPDERVTIVCTDTRHPEDRAVGEHLAALLAGEMANSSKLTAAVIDGGERHLATWAPNESAERKAELRADFTACAAVDAHDLVMLAEPHPDGHVLLTRAR